MGVGVSMSRTRLRIKVPASSANLGPGFDCFGLALSLFNEVELDLDLPSGVVLRGRDAEVLAGQENLVVKAMEAHSRCTGRSLPPAAMVLDNSIPTTRGLGSSAAAIVAGLTAANLLTGEPLTRAELMHLAGTMEGHGDNVGAALHGGMVVSFFDGQRHRAVEVPVGDDLVAVVFVPSRSLCTKEARAVLPATVSLADAIHNLGRATQLVVEMQQRRYDLLAKAMEDRLHQPYRARLVDGLPELMVASLDAGAHGACLSGAGPSVLALTGSDRSGPVGLALAQAARERGLAGEVLQLAVCPTGVEGRWEGSPGLR
jgi:homoserine kinase